MNRNEPRQPDIESLSYCCLECSDQCQIFKATASDDRAVKQAVADIWTKEIRQPFTADDVFCCGCKQEGRPQNRALLQCTVRRCAKGKHIESCSLCGDLPACDKDLWKRWPDVKIRALEMRQTMQCVNIKA